MASHSQKEAKSKGPPYDKPRLMASSGSCAIYFPGGIAQPQSTQNYQDWIKKIRS